MERNTKFLSQRGFSLLEVVIAIAIFAIGMLALASLQGSLTRSSADANLRTTAANIGERTLEDLRAFGRIDTDPAGLILAYEDIATKAAEVVKAAENSADGGITFSRTIEVTPYYYVLAEDTFSATAPTGIVVSDFKLVEVTVSWAAVAADNAGFQLDESQNPLSSADMGSGSIILSAMINSISTQGSSRVATQEEDNGFVPIVNYTPGLNPDIVSLSLGDDKFKESLLPEPDVKRKNELVETRFDVITYSQSGSGALFLRREEFAVVSCECTFGTDSSKLARRPVIWAGDEYVRGHSVQKAYGEPANNQQSPLCTSCCADHHDGGSSSDDHSVDASVNVYDPFKPSTEYVSSGGDHKHYTRNSRTGLLTPVTSGTYVEACRLVRQDGFFRVAQNFRREDLNVFPDDYLDETSEINLYSSFVTGATTEYAGLAKGFGNSPNYTSDPPCIGPLTGPDRCAISEAPTQADYDTAIALDGNGAPTQIPSWTTLPFGLDLTLTQQLRSRGVYLDYLSYDMRTVLTNCIDGTNTADEEVCKSGDVELDRTGSVNMLEMLPFFDVQMTKLNRWNELPINMPVETTNDILADGNTHSRGNISKEGDGDSTVVAKGHRSNLGFTDSFPIDLSYDAQVTDSNMFVHAGTGTTPDGTNISGTLSHTFSNPNLDILVTGLNGVLCGQTTESYSCVIPPGSTVNPQIELTGYGKKFNDRYACSIGTILTLDSAVSVANGANAKSVFLLAGVDAGETYNFVIQDTECAPVVIGF